MILFGLAWTAVGGDIMFVEALPMTATGKIMRRILRKIAAGEYDLTLADSHIVAIELGWRESLVVAVAIAKPSPLFSAKQMGYGNCFPTR